MSGCTSLAAYGESCCLLHLAGPPPDERPFATTIHAQTVTVAAETPTEQMAYMAEQDVLTSLPNRALLADRTLRMRD